LSAKDSMAKEYFADNARFADLCNNILYGGREVILPENLKERDTTEVLTALGLDKKTIAMQKLRDIFKNASIKYTGKSYVVLIGVENQSDIHYAIPVKNMFYDVMAYGNQVKETAKKPSAMGTPSRMPSQKIFLLKAQTGLSALTSSGARSLLLEFIFVFNSFPISNTASYYTLPHTEKKGLFRFLFGIKRERRLKRQRSSSIYAPGTRKCIACGRVCVPASKPFAASICAGDTWNRFAMPKGSSPACASNN